MSVINQSHIKKMGLAVIALGFVLGCSQKDMPLTNAGGVEGKDTQVLTHIGDEQNRFMVLGSGAFVQELKGQRIQLATAPDTARFLNSISSKMEVEDVEDASVQEQSLTVGYPLSLLNEYQTMGAVITGVSDTQSESLGGLKLTDLSPIHVRTIIAKVAENKFALAILGCASKCTEASPKGVLLTIPVLGIDDKKQMVLLDLASIAKGMNLLEIMDPDGDFTNLVTKTAKTSFVDYSLSTLVFDIEANMVPVKPNPTTKDTTITTRWYLRLGSAFNPAFIARPATDGVGFFMTERSNSSKIQRFSLPEVVQGLSADSDGPVKYYIKNVPEDYKGYFKNAFDAWNEKFKELAGRKLLSYEFVDANDPRQKQLVAGDVRYNIVEWDLVNKAGYGGLGPSIANQFTGEILSANVLVQGPTIVDIYTKWFKASQNANMLTREGRDDEAKELLKRAEDAIVAKTDTSRLKKYAFTLGKSLEFSVRSQMPSLEDPLIAKGDFDIVPAGYTYEKYMVGYFLDLVGHELGHNLGLRHNFRGNLSGDIVPSQGKVSHSIMEYLGRGYRYLDAIGTYDLMALKYGYLGVIPTEKGMFCTDEDVPAVQKDKPVTGSPECSRDDATKDPFGFFEGRLARAVDLVTNRASTEAPLWKTEELSSQIDTVILGLGLYAATATTAGPKLTHFFIGGDRPTSAEGIRPYVIAKIKKQLCDPTLEVVMASKSTEEGKALVKANLAMLRSKVATKLGTLGVNTAEVSCQ